MAETNIPQVPARIRRQDREDATRLQEKLRAKPTATLNVYVREVVVHDERDPGPGRGEYDIAFAAVAGPGARATQQSERWQTSVSTGRRYAVGRWTGAVPVNSVDGWLTIAGGGVERDAVNDDTALGGIAVLRADRNWGIGRWWRTTNGPHFDLVFCVVEGDRPDAALPVWTGETYDAPGPHRPTMAEYKSFFGTLLDSAL